MIGRPTKLDKKVQARIVKALKTGATVADVCQHVGLAESTFYDWVARGEADENGYSEFSEAVSRARNAAKMVAMGTLRNAMTPYSQTTTTTEAYTETRINKFSGREYTHTEKTEKKSVTLYPGDWKAAVEYLKRRFSDEWGDKQKIEDWRDQAIVDIRAGKIPYEALADAFDTDLAAQLFAAAGIPISSGTSTE